MDEYGCIALNYQTKFSKLLKDPKNNKKKIIWPVLQKLQKKKK